MKAIQNFEDIKNLKTGDRLLVLAEGYEDYYRFLCFHPRIKRDVILLDHNGNPVRLCYTSMYEKFYTDYTHREILEYRKDYALKEVESIERALAMLEDTSEPNNDEVL